MTAALDITLRLPHAAILATSRVHGHCGEVREQTTDQREHLDIYALLDARRDEENERQERIAVTLAAALRSGDIDTMRACVEENRASIRREREIDEAADWHQRAVRARNAGAHQSICAALETTAWLLGMRNVEPLGGPEGTAA